MTLKLFERALLLANVILEELESQSESRGYSQTPLDCCVNSIFLPNPTQPAPALALLSLAEGRIFYISQPEAEPTTSPCSEIMRSQDFPKMCVPSGIYITSTGLPSRGSAEHLTAKNLNQGPNRQWRLDLPKEKQAIAIVHVVPNGALRQSGVCSRRGQTPQGPTELSSPYLQSIARRRVAVARSKSATSNPSLPYG